MQTIPCSISEFLSDKSVSFIIPCRKGGYLVGLGQTVTRFDWDTKKLTQLVKVEDGLSTRFNDAKCDASGRLWCGKLPTHIVPYVMTRLYMYSVCISCTRLKPNGRINSLGLDLQVARYYVLVGQKLIIVLKTERYY